MVGLGPGCAMRRAHRIVRSAGSLVPGLSLASLGLLGGPAQPLAELLAERYPDVTFPDMVPGSFVEVRGRRWAGSCLEGRWKGRSLLSVWCCHADNGGQAVTRSRREMRFLAVYLHHEGREGTAAFCR